MFRGCAYSTSPIIRISPNTLKTKLHILFLLLILATSIAYSQDIPDQNVNYQLAVVIGGDTIPRYYLREVTVVKQVSLTEAEIRRALALKARGRYGRVVVAGCYPQRYPEAVAKFPGVDVWQGVPADWDSRI